VTVLVGILCEDGVVIGSDSSATYGPAPMVKTIEYDALKLEIVEDAIITAISGAVGLGQRFNEQLGSLFRTLMTPHRGGAQQMTMTPMGPMILPLHAALSKVPVDHIPLDTISPIETGTLISETIIANFRRTQSSIQTNTAQGWGLGALVAFVSNNNPQLIEFDGVQFHPELKGQPDPARGDRPRVWRSVSMGSGQMMSDPFLGHAYRLLFGDTVPRVDRAKLAVSWTLDHVIRYNTGGIGGAQRLAILERNRDGAWQASYVDPKGEIKQQLDEMERYISDFGRQTATFPDAPETPHARTQIQLEEPAESVAAEQQQRGGETPT
jgi:hypothetical protein